MSRLKFGVFSLFILLTAYCRAQAQPLLTPQSCDNLTFVQCERFVVQELSKIKAGDVKSTIELAGIWNKRFRSAYQATIKTGPSETDIDRIEEEIKSQLDPISKVKSSIIENMLKTYFPRLASFAAFLETAPVAALSIFLTPSQTATGFDEVMQANKRVQAKITILLAPSLKSDWQTIYLNDLKKVAPVQIGPKP